MLMRGDAFPLPVGAGVPAQKVPGPGPSAEAPAAVPQPLKPPVAPPQVSKGPVVIPPKLPEAKRPVWVIGGIVGALVVVALGVWGFMALRKKPVAPTPTVQTTSQPETAPPSTATPAAPSPLTTVHVLTDLESGSVSLDGSEVGQLKEGQFSLDEIAAGNHTLAIKAPGGGTEITFEAAPGALARLTKVTATGDLKVVAVASRQPDVQVLSSFGTVKATFDGKEAGNVGAARLDIKDVPTGQHDLVLGSGKARKTVSFESSAVPGLTTFISTERNVGSLLVRTGEDGVSVTVDGRTLPQLTSRGQLILTNLEPRQYQITVAKAGFQPVPPKSANVEKGGEARVSFALHPITTASLVLSGAPPAAKVLLDGATLGTVHPDGTFSAPNVQEGQHTIELRRDGFEPKQLSRNFSPGQSVTLSGADVTLTKTASSTPTPAAVAPPKLVVLTVPGAQVTLDQQALGTADASGKLEIDKAPVGSHTVEVSAAGFHAYQQKVSLSPNQVVTLKPNLAASFSVQHKHMIGGCRGNIVIEEGKIAYKSENTKDSFERPLNSVKTAGPADFGKGFYLEFTDGERIFFHTPNAAQDLGIILGAMKSK